jgi:uncharacterized protein
MAAAPSQEKGAEKQAPRAAEPAAGTTVTIIDGMSGKRQDVPIGAGHKQADAAPSPEAGRPTDPASSRMIPIEPRLAEMTVNGPIPKIAPDGARPADVYAHAPNPPAPGGPRIAIVLTRLSQLARSRGDFAGLDVGKCESNQWSAPGSQL